MRTKYRITSGLMVFAIVVAASSALIGNQSVTIGALVVTLLCLASLVYLVKCVGCGVRPASRIFWFWLLLLDIEFFISDILLLSRCPKCKQDPFSK